MLAGAGFGSVVVVTGGAVGKGATDDVVAGEVEAGGLACVVGVGSDRGGVEATGFGCPKAEVTAAQSSAAKQRGRSTRYV